MLLGFFSLSPVGEPGEEVLDFGWGVFAEDVEPEALGFELLGELFGLGHIVDEDLECFAGGLDVFAEVEPLGCGAVA